MKKLFSAVMVLLFVLGLSLPAMAVSYPYYSDIYVTKNPDKMEYKVGESFDSAGLQISGTVVKSATEKGANALGLGSLSVSPSKFTKAGKQTVKLSLSCKGKSGGYETFTTSLTVTVKESSSAAYPYYSKIFVSKNPKKMEYEVGDYFDQYGLELSGTVVKSASETGTNPLGLSSLKVSPSKFTKAGKQTVKLSLSCKGKSGAFETFSTSLTVTVKEKTPSSKPKITKHPTGEDVLTGGGCSFIARADGADSITWYLVSGDGNTTLKAKDAPKTHAGLKVSGSSEEKLKLSKIPASLDGWKAYAVFKNSVGSATTHKADINVTDAVKTVTPEPATPVPVTPEPATPVPATPEPAKNGLAELLNQLADVNETPEPEIVYVEVEPEKERCVITCINCHFQFLNKSLNAAGEKLTEFDFEDPYINPNTKEECEGGLLSCYVTADIPKGKQIDYWLINGVEYHFPQNVTKFGVRELNEATVYEPVFKGQKKTEKKDKDEGDEELFSINCINCTFKSPYDSGTSGYAHAGTVITVTAGGNSSVGYWTGTVNKGSYSYPVAKGSFTYTVKGNCTFVWNPKIN